MAEMKHSVSAKAGENINAISQWPVMLAAPAWQCLKAAGWLKAWPLPHSAEASAGVNQYSTNRINSNGVMKK
jgi:hypothetical protein